MTRPAVPQDPRPYDAEMMALALAQAERARGRTRPNPLVGAVIVDETQDPPQVLALGHHARAGTAHAEVAALQQLGPAAVGRTLYVTLEPCNHVGRTGRCTDAILAAGIARVVVGMRDPNPRVTGGGIERLLEAGVAVTVGVAGGACQDQNRGYLRWVQTGLPHLILKAAVSLDGRIAPVGNEPYWLTGPEARVRLHQLRDVCDAILVGAGTVIADDPRLTVRLPDAVRRDDQQPLRVVLDGALRTPLTAAVAGPGTLILTSHTGLAARAGHAAALSERGAQVVALPGEGTRIDPRSVAQALGKQNLLTVLCEGGAQVHGELLAAGLYQEAALFVAPVLLGEGAVPLLAGYTAASFPQAPWLGDVTITPLGRDVLIQGLLAAPDAGLVEAQRE